MLAPNCIPSILSHAVLNFSSDPKEKQVQNKIKIRYYPHAIGPGLKHKWTKFHKNILDELPNHNPICQILHIEILLSFFYIIICHSRWLHGKSKTIFEDIHLFIHSPPKMNQKSARHWEKRELSLDLELELTEIEMRQKQRQRQR